MSLPNPGTTVELYLAQILVELQKLNNGSVGNLQSTSEDEVDLVEPTLKKKKRKSRFTNVLKNR